MAEESYRARIRREGEQQAAIVADLVSQRDQAIVRAEAAELVVGEGGNAGKDEQIAKLTARIAELEAERDQAASDRDATLSLLDAERKAEVARLTAEIAAANQRAVDAQAQLEGRAASQPAVTAPSGAGGES